MKISRCYYCGSDQSIFYAEENGYNLVKCSECGLLFIENRPDDEEIRVAHKQGVHRGLNSFDVNSAFNPAKTARYRKVLKDLFSGNRNLGNVTTWLDIGCGHGEFMMAVQKHCHGKIFVKGSEPNVHKQESAKKRGLDVEYFELESHKRRYDIISMLNVFSHLPDPPKFLESLRTILNPGGELILETGDTADIPAKHNFRPFYLPDHLSFASETIVVGILKKIGFEILSIQKYPLLRFDFSSISVELFKLFLPKYSSKFPLYFDLQMYTPVDMFIRARLNN